MSDADRGSVAEQVLEAMNPPVVRGASPAVHLLRKIQLDTQGTFVMIRSLFGVAEEIRCLMQNHVDSLSAEEVPAARRPDARRTNQASTSPGDVLPPLGPVPTQVGRLPLQELPPPSIRSSSSSSSTSTRRSPPAPAAPSPLVFTKAKPPARRARESTPPEEDEVEDEEESSFPSPNARKRPPPCGVENCDCAECEVSYGGLKRRTRTFWTDEETGALLDGIAAEGIGNWSAILRWDLAADQILQNAGKTAQQLSDRYRQLEKTGGM